jgi:hypothetical protein
VHAGIAAIGALDGEVWFKVDRATEAGVELVNGVRIAPAKIAESLSLCADLAPTWVQTCYFALDGMEPAAEEQSAYLALVEALKEKIKGVHLYGLARPSMQPAAERLSNVSPECFQRFADRISALGVVVVSNP